MIALNKIAFVSSGTDRANAALESFQDHFGAVDVDDADVIVALGGDGLMLQTLHRKMNSDVPIYGMNFGSQGFLMNEPSEPDALRDRLEKSEVTIIHPLQMNAVDENGEAFFARAINEVSLWRQSHQAAKLEIEIDGKTRMEELICDGILLATPAGSTAYNLSAHGPILPINAPMLALTPISPFRPRRWRGAILPSTADVKIQVQNPQKRPVNVSADNFEIKSVRSVHITEDTKSSLLMMFDPGHSLGERILNEQFWAG